MSLATSNRDGGRTNEAGHLRGVIKNIIGEVMAGLAVSQRGAGANMSVDIAIGDAVIPRSDGTYGHPAWNDAVYNQLISTADGSNPRRDVIVMYIDYGQAPSTGVANNTNGVVKIKSVPGTAAGSPVDPSDSAIQSSVGSGNPYIKLARVRVAAGATSINNSVIDDIRTMSYSRDAGGWNSLSSSWDSWQFGAWNSTYRIATINVPNSGVFTLGQKIRYWQQTGGWKYGFVMTKPNSTSITVFQGNAASGYVLNNERIYLPAYSRDKSPDGFPADARVWTMLFNGSSAVSVNTPANGVWNNLGAGQVPVGAGLWDIGYDVTTLSARTTAGNTQVRVTLSKANNTEDDTDFTINNGLNQSAAQTMLNLTITSHVEKTVEVANNTPFYLNIAPSSGSLSSMSIQGGVGQHKIYAKCAYL